MSQNARPREQAQFLETKTAAEGEARASLDPRGRREHSRFRVDLDVTVTSEHNFYAGFIENLSVGGLFIATHQLKAVGERVEFSVHLPDNGEAIHGTGVVRWVRVYSESSNVSPGMGIRFDDLDAAARQRVETFLAQREPLFYDED
jgi:type IV pilus assembly protein PilZ